jgi:dihydrofolate reductase
MSAVPPPPIVISLVVAVAENGVIGVRGGLPWRMKADLRKFRNITMGKPMIMGRKTFDSIGGVLDGRDSIVVTTRPESLPAGATGARNAGDALRIAEEKARERRVGEICVIGGEALFRAALGRADRLHVTHVAGAPAGDVFFPEIAAEWIEVAREPLPSAEGDTTTGTYVVYERRR